MEWLFKVNHFVSVKTQKLSNMVMLSPCIVWIRTGYKRLISATSYQELDDQSLLFVKSNQRLTFENQPRQLAFQSCQICFYHYPDSEMLKQSLAVSGRELNLATSKMTPELRHSLDILCRIDTRLVSSDVQRYWLNGFYQLLAEKGLLHSLFDSGGKSLRETLSEYFARAPDFSYKLDTVSAEFGMSRATLIRRLHKEQTSFRDILNHVRMNHSIMLIQQGHRDIRDIALSCGYQSSQRFNQRFQAQFGSSVRQYIETIGDPHA